MKARVFVICASAAFAAAPIVLAGGSPAAKIDTKTNAKVDTKAKKSAPARGALAPPETLTGKIMMIDPKSNVVVVKDSTGTTFDIVVTKATRIRAADRRLSLKDLSSDTNKPVSVQFVPERSGDIARSIQVTG